MSSHAELLAARDPGAALRSTRVVQRQLYPEAALAGAGVAGDAVDPEYVAAGVHLHVVALGRRADPNLREVEPGLGGEAVAAEGQVDGGGEGAAVATSVVLPEGRQMLAPAGAAPVMARELAAHLEDAGGGRAAGGERRRQREEEEEGQRSAKSATGRLHPSSFASLAFLADPPLPPPQRQ